MTKDCVNGNAQQTLIYGARSQTISRALRYKQSFEEITSSRNRITCTPLKDTNQSARQTSIFTGHPKSSYEANTSSCG